jgi:hypothetical protein
LDSGFFGLLKLKIGLEAFKSRALLMGLKICKKNYKILLHKPTKFFQSLWAGRAEFSGLSGSCFWSYIVKSPAQA